MGHINPPEFAPPQQVSELPPHESHGKLFLRFLRFGLLAWGGPFAQIAMIRQELVEEEKWLTPARFNRVLAVYQALPGPEAQELCVYFGVLAGGRLGGFLAGFAFLLPGLLLMLLFSWLYVRFGMTSSFAVALFYGCKPAAVALVIRAIHRIGGHALTHPVLWVAAALSALAAILNVNFLIILVVSGLLSALWQRQNPLRVLPVLLILPLLWLPTLLFPAIATGTPGTPSLFLVGLRSGLLTFGGAYTVISFLQNDAVIAGKWMTNTQFLDGIALTGILPAPLVIFGAFVGYVGGGLGGALALTTGIFLPAFGFSIWGHRHVEKLVENEAAHALLDGITAGVIGLIVVTAVKLLGEAVVDISTGAIFAVALFLTFQWKQKTAVLWIMLGAAIAGFVAQR